MSVVEGSRPQPGSAALVCARAWSTTRVCSRVVDPARPESNFFRKKFRGRFTWDEAVTELISHPYDYGTVAARGLLAMADRHGTYTDDGTVITSHLSGLGRVYEIGSVT